MKTLLRSILILVLIVFSINASAKKSEESAVSEPLPVADRIEALASLADFIVVGSFEIDKICQRLAGDGASTRWAFRNFSQRLDIKFLPTKILKRPMAGELSQKVMTIRSPVGSLACKASARNLYHTSIDIFPTREEYASALDVLAGSTIADHEESEEVDVTNIYLDMYANMMHNLHLRGNSQVLENVTIKLGSTYIVFLRGDDWESSYEISEIVILEGRYLNSVKSEIP